MPGVMVAFEEPDKQAMFTQIMQQVQAKGLTPINEVDLTDPLEMNILYAGRLRIVLGTINDIAYKVDWAWRLVTPQLEESLKETAVGILDVSSRTEEAAERPAIWRAAQKLCMMFKSLPLTSRRKLPTRRL